MDIKKIKDLESMFQIEFLKFKNEIMNEINSITYPDVKIVSDNIVIIKSSQLSESWLPEYHIPGKQAEQISTRIQKARNMNELICVFKELSNTKMIVCGKNKQKINCLLQQKIDEVLKELESY